MPTPARFPGGISTARSTGLMGQFGMPDPTLWHTFFDDFYAYTAGDWTITTTEAGAGSATEANSAGAGGILLITNDAADDDNDFFQLPNESFRPTSGKKLIFKARFKVSDATQSDIVMGLQITDTSPLDVTDGMFFHKADGSATLNFLVEKDNTATTTAATTLANDTYVIVGFYYDGGSSIKIYVNDVHVGTSATTNIPNDEDLCVSFGLQNGEAVAKTMSIDYIFVAQER